MQGGRRGGRHEEEVRMPRPPIPLRTLELGRQPANAFQMAKKGKSRVIIVRLLSMAATGFFYTFRRKRTAPPMSMLKYDPIVRKHVLFLEQKRKGGK
ncbi:hypothetical protein SAPIO_CDS9339 [Scedosporium apiospermum]|uniref:Large ribosomal subunit protein bL33m n=1 Tax=Pseudallescheria apiosperma TaxID=563466 RepID=A0A084FWL1_PSEDA|nr:uncharacterized protein SAPIO_CDS9339 [Scedosporium apiospermum]KEZ39473.1 hypothetical protein SAPIO_CDS9339 [Scedosporium apiospermum]